MHPFSNFGGSIEITVFPSRVEKRAATFLESNAGAKPVPC